MTLPCDPGGPIGPAGGQLAMGPVGGLMGPLAIGPVGGLMGPLPGGPQPGLAGIPMPVPGAGYAPAGGPGPGKAPEAYPGGGKDCTMPDPGMVMPVAIGFPAIGPRPKSAVDPRPRSGTDAGRTSPWPARSGRLPIDCQSGMPAGRLLDPGGPWE